MKNYGRWGPPPPLAEVWRIPPGTQEDHAKEQDRAAGGRTARLVSLPDGRTVTASIALKNLGRKVYGYLRYSVDGGTVTKYIGNATEPTRPKALKRAWGLAHDKGLLTHTRET